MFLLDILFQTSMLANTVVARRYSIFQDNYNTIISSLSKCTVTLLDLFTLILRAPPPGISRPLHSPLDSFHCSFRYSVKAAVGADR